MDLHVSPNENLSLVIKDFDYSIIPEQHKEPSYHYNHIIDNHQQDSKDDLNMMTHHTTTSHTIWLPADKHPEIAPKEYKNWIETHGTNNEIDEENKKVTVTRKKSVLSNVSYQSEDTIGNSSSSSDEDITPPTTPTTEVEYPIIPEPSNRQTNTKSISPQSQKREITIERKSRAKNSKKIESITNKNAVDDKSNNKKSWLSGLFQDNKNKVKTLKKKNGISNFFSKTLSSNSCNTKPSSPTATTTTTTTNDKKTKRKEKVTPTVQPIPTRYNVQLERAIYRLSHFKLNNQKRPLQQKVTISNMMYWYLCINEQETYQQQIINQRQQTYFNQLCQSTFEPPPPGGGVVNYQQNNFTSPTRSTSPPLSFITTKKDTNKKKYKPVRNTEYSIK